MIAKALNEVHSGVLLVVGCVVAHSLYLDLDVGAHDGFVLFVPVHVVEAGSDLASSECAVGRSRHRVVVASQVRSQHKFGVFDSFLIQSWLRRLKRCVLRVLGVLSCLRSMSPVGTA